MQKGGRGGGHLFALIQKVATRQDVRGARPGAGLHHQLRIAFRKGLPEFFNCSVGRREFRDRGTPLTEQLSLL
jgi:hypothetical protein